MAVIALKKLEDQLNCSICLDTYTNPKQLQCNHIFCQQCLVRLVIRDQQGHLTVTCPNCRHVTPVPTSGVRDLQASFRVNQLLEIVEEHKKTLTDTPSLESIRARDPHAKTTIGCPQHNGREVELYCETCEETICYKCIKKGEKHQTHDYEELVEAFERYQEEITLSLEPMEKQLIAIDKALPEFDACHDEIADQRAAVEADIHKTIAQLQETLDVRRTELISQLDQLTEAKFKSLAVQRDQLETIQAQLRSCIHFMRENLKTSNRGEAMRMKSTTARQIKEITTTFQQGILEPSIESDIIFLALADLSADCKNYGKVYDATGPPDFTKSNITGKKVDKAKVGEKFTTVLQIVNSDNLPCITTTSISCELVSEITGTTAKGSIERRGKNQYEISYLPTIKGRHQLHIKVKGLHIRGSPFLVCVTSLMENIGTLIKTISKFDGWMEPMGIAVNQNGEVVVTERNECCVAIISPSGERLRSFGMRGSGQGQFDHPCGVAVDCEGNILVADTFNNRIQKFTAQGAFMKEVHIKGTFFQRSSYPGNIAHNASNGRLYVMTITNTIQILNSDLSYFGSFGMKSGKGLQVQTVDSPYYLACDCTGKVYVSDRSNNCIQVFTAEGKFLRMIGECDAHVLQLPTGIAVDASGIVYVSEKYNQVSIFTSDGQFVKTIGRHRPEIGRSSLAIDTCGVVYVCACDYFIQIL